MKVPFPYRRVIRLLALGGVLATTSLTVAACGEPASCPTTPVPQGLAVAVGGRANNPRPSWPGELDDELTTVIGKTRTNRNTGVTLIRADGRPTIGCVRKFDPTAANDTADRSNQDAFRNAVRDEVAQLTADEPEANPLAAMSVAGAAAGPGGTVVLIDSGLQTVAPLDFRTKGLLDHDLDDLVDRLDRGGALPDLRGRKVVLVGIGYTAPPQDPLTEDRRTQLVELWQKLAARAGAGTVVTVTAPNTSKAHPDVPTVAPVAVPTAALAPAGCNTNTVLWDDGAVGFRPESTTLRDEARAREVLARFAAWLDANPSARAVVTGSVAHYGADDPDGLSLARAERVRDLLAGSPGQVTAQGTGWGPFPSKTAPPDPASDRQNRRVVIRLLCRA